MKRILFFVCLFLVASVSTTAIAGKKKNKKKKKADTEVVEPVNLVTSSDSTSYAAGYTATNGLVPYLITRLHLDTAYIAEFDRGYREALAKKNDKAYNAYIIGANIASQANDQILPNIKNQLEGSSDSINVKAFNQGFLAGAHEDTTVMKMKEARDIIETKADAAVKTRNEAYKNENEAWLKSNATKDGVVTLPSGLQYKVLKTGNGPKPKATDKVQVVYEGKTIDGKVFDATANHGGRKTDTFRCDQVIKGWTEALTSMTVGSKWEIYIPQELAYGNRQAGQIKPYSTLIFTVELVGIAN